MFGYFSSTPVVRAAISAKSPSLFLRAPITKYTISSGLFLP